MHKISFSTSQLLLQEIQVGRSVLYFKSVTILLTAGEMENQAHMSVLGPFILRKHFMFSFSIFTFNQ